MATRKQSINTKLLVPILICFLIFGLSLVWAINFFSVRTSTDAFRRELAQKDGLIGEFLAAAGRALEDKALWFAAHAARSGLAIPGEQTESLLKALELDGLALTGPEGDILFQSGGEMIAAPYLRTIASYTEDLHATARIYSLGKGMAIIAAAPVFQGGALAGYAVLEYSLQSPRFLKAIKELTNCEVDVYQGTARRASTAGMAAGADAVSGASTFNADASSAVNIIADTVLGLGQPYEGEYQSRGERFYAIHIPLRDSSGSRIGILSMGLPVSSVYRMVRVLDGVVIPLFTGGTLLLFIILIILTRFVVIQPLNVTAAAADNLASREADFTYQIPIERNDEIGLIIGNINTFISTLRSLILQIKEAQSSLQTIGQNLAGQSEESVKANSEIMAVALDIKNQTENQNLSLNRTNTVLGETAVELGKLNALIQNQSAAITQSSGSIEGMTRTIDGVTESVGQMKNQFRALVEVSDSGKQKQDAMDQKIKQILTQSETLIGANTVIAKIASQTNLLAMNAAIEAAHAGAAGAGFSVVADEIRSLAENAQLQSTEIKKELSAITESIHDTVKSSAESREAFNLVTGQINATDDFILAIDRAMDEQRAVSSRLLEVLQAMTASSAEVKSTSADLTAQMDQVKAEMDGLTDIVTAIQKSIIGMGENAREVNRAAENVRGLARDTHENIQIMERTIGSFKV
jgi:methyl-accepting chemotaxis protein